MERRGVVAGLAAVGLAPGLARAARRRPDLRVMSFNVRLPRAEDGPDRWEARRDLFGEAIRRADHDSIGKVGRAHV